MTDPLSVALTAYEAYAEGDRAKLESVLSPEFHFTSPLDNRLDRERYLERCWPNHEVIASFDFVSTLTDGAIVLITYDATRKDGSRFRNTERLVVTDGRLREVEVYFGWNLPHPADAGDSTPDPWQSEKPQSDESHWQV